MKIGITILFAFLCLNIQAQTNCAKYDTAMKHGYGYFNKKKYDLALIEFQAAQIAARECDKPTNTPAVELKKVFDSINSQKQEAVEAKHNAEKATKKTKTVLAIANSLNTKNEKLINAFYFYDGKFALAFKDNKYGFINKEGDPVIPYQYDKAEQFDYTGFAKVSLKEEGKIIPQDRTKPPTDIDYLIDTSENEYKLASSVEELKKKNDFIALDLRDDARFDYQIWYSPSDTLKIKLSKLQILIADGYFPRQYEDFVIRLPNGIGELKNLTHLFLRNNFFSRLPPEIGKLKSLIYLDLRGDPSTDTVSYPFQEPLVLPSEIGQLEALQTLKLDYNLLTVLPDEIGQLKNLKELTLSHAEVGNLDTMVNQNRLTSLTPKIGRLKSLQKLDLSYNQLTVLPTEIGELENLRELNLKGNPISESELRRIQLLLPQCTIIK